jgi:hypothetical protein
MPLANQFLDRRTKLLDCQKERLICMHQEGVSIHRLSKIFKVNRRLVQFTLFPERMAHNKLLRKQRGGEAQYYDRVEHNLAIKEHRQHKKEVFKKLI